MAESTISKIISFFIGKKAKESDLPPVFLKYKNKVYIRIDTHISTVRKIINKQKDQE